MKRALWIASLVLTLTLLSCGKKSGGMIDGVIAEDYYNSMAYQKPAVGDSGPSKFLTQDDNAMAVQTLPKAKGVYVDVAVFLTDKTRQFTIIYDESVGCTNGAKKIRFFRSAPLEGTWFVSNSRINLGMYATGERFVSGSDQTIKLKFNRDIHVQGLAGKFVTLTFKKMPYSLSDLKSSGAVTDYKFAADSLDSSGLCK